MASQTSIVAKQVRLMEWYHKSELLLSSEKSPQSMFGGLQSRTGVCGASSADRESSAPGRQQLKTDSYSAKFQRIGT